MRPLNRQLAVTLCNVMLCYVISLYTLDITKYTYNVYCILISHIFSPELVKSDQVIDSKVINSALDHKL